MPREGQVTRRRYRGERFGGGSKGGGGLPGMKITKPNSGVQIWKPSWNKTRTVFRVFPGLDEENTGDYTPFRNLATNDYAPYMHGDWIQEITATTMGDQDRRVTFIVHDPATSSDARNNPACKLAQAIMKAVPTGLHSAAWNTLIHKAPPSFMAPLTMPQNFWLMQGVLVEHRSKGFETATGYKGVGGDDTVVLMISKTAGEKILEDLMMQRDDNNDFVYADITDLTDGWFVGISQNGTSWPGDAEPDMGGSGGATHERSFYDVRFMKSHAVNNVDAPVKLNKDFVDSKTKLWDDILYYPTVAEQLELIIDCGIPHDALSYALKPFYNETDGLSARVLRVLDPQKYASPAQQPVAAVSATDSTATEEKEPTAAAELGAPQEEVVASEATLGGALPVTEDTKSAIDALKDAQKRKRDLEDA